jgi:4-hydroxybenzoate polyprenyltransferase
MTILTQIVVLHALLIPSGLELALETWQFALLIGSVALLTASGNVINDIYDVHIDMVNKPDKLLIGKKISEKAAYNWYIILTSIGVIMGFILSNSIDKPIFSSVFIVVAFLLYTYASTLKSIPIAGNIIISLLVGMVIIVTGVFELLPSITDSTRSEYAMVMKVLVYFAEMAFIINLIREWIKDCEDVNGDKLGGRQTIAIILGRHRAARCIALFIWMVIFGMGYFAISFLNDQQVSLLYWVFLLIAPLFYVAIQLWNASSARKFHMLSQVLKVILVFGIFYMFFYNIDLISDF